MARVTLKRQLDEELNVGDEFKDLMSIGEELRDDLTISPRAMHVPRDDDTYTAMHEQLGIRGRHKDKDAPDEERASDELGGADVDTKKKPTPEETTHEATDSKPA